MITIRELSYTYPTREAAALEGLNLTIEAAQLTLLSGGTGSGKSTLAMACVGAVPAYTGGRFRGEILIGGQTIKNRPLAQTAREVGILLQNVEEQVFTDLVEDEIVFGLENRALQKAEMQDRLEEALSLTETHHLRHRPIDQLSAGEQQRVVLASLLALKQKVLLLDEPLAYLDRASCNRLLRLLRRLAEDGGTVVLVEHRRDLALPHCHREVHLRGGRIVAVEHELLSVEPFAGVEEGESILELRSFHLKRGGRELLRQGELSLLRGGCGVVLGDNGSGKTTLFRALLGLESLEMEKGEICGLPIGKVPLFKAVEKIALVLQNPNHQLTESTVLAEIGPAHAVELESLGLAGLEECHPQSLSVGQKRRLTLAGALARKPELLLLDEPSVGQDDQSLELLLERLRLYLEEGGSILAATHDQRVAEILSPRAWILEGGKLGFGSTRDYFQERAS